MNNHSIYRSSSLLTLGIAEAVSNLGNWITMMAVFALLVFKDEGGVAESSGVFLAGLLPILIFSPVSGWISDRIDRKWVMILSQLFSGLAIIGLVYVEDLKWIYALLALQAVFISLMTPARQASIPALVPPSDLPAANAFLQQLNGLVKIAAPMLAGGVLALLSPHQAIWLDVLSFGLSALILARLPSLPPASDTAPTKTATQPRSHRTPMNQGLKILFTIVFFSITVIVGFDVLAPIYVRDVLAGDEKLFGSLVSLIGVGTLLASFFILRRKQETNPWKMVITGLLLLACIPGAMAWAVSLQDEALRRWVTMGSSLVGGIGNGLLVIQAATLLQRLSPPEQLGRMAGFYQSTAVAGQLVGMLATPLLVPQPLSLGVYFWIAAGLMVLLGLFLLSLSQRPTLLQASPLSKI